MNEHDPIDLSPLDPMRDPARWDAVVARTMARVDAALAERERRQDPLAMIAAWRRPVLLAASVTLAMLIPVEVLLELRETRMEQVERLVAISTALDEVERAPSASDFLRALGTGAAP
jgi:hypothetical protein